MRPDDIHEFVRRRPFQPFRIPLTDGRTYDIFHPEFAMVGRSTIAVGIPRPGEAIYDRLVTISLVHVMQIELIEPAATENH